MDSLLTAESDTIATRRMKHLYKILVKESYKLNIKHQTLIAIITVVYTTTEKRVKKKKLSMISTKLIFTVSIAIDNYGELKRAGL